ncbi:MAG: hypothetical protein K2X81_09860 [Candidatus Obscuribacterales bacterium]|nr:hypothetical protein [Candidatus Obscuribacterales bacterium]
MKDSKKTQTIILVSSAFVLGAVVAPVVLNAIHSDKKVAEQSSTSSSQQLADGAATTKVQTVASVTSPAIAANNELSSVTLSKPQYPATKRIDAAFVAKQSVGRKDPMVPLDSDESYISDVTSASNQSKATVEKAETRTVVAKAKDDVASSKVSLIPPPPPRTLPLEHVQAQSWKSSPPNGLGGVRLTAVIGDKAMLSVRREGSSRSERPEVICLSAGEQTKTVDNVPVSVVSVDKDRVVFEVGGDRFVRSLPEIR